MRKYRDLTGEVFGYLRVDSESKLHYYPNGKSEHTWSCTCLLCGNVCVVSGKSLRQNHTQSCGCLHKNPIPPTTHGKSDTRLYYVWKAMKQRCNDPNCKEYKWYGARGIKVCFEWEKNFEKFYNWSISAGYDETAPRGTYTLDRKDTNGDYCPSNCRYITLKEQENNRRDNHIINYKGKDYTLAELERLTGIKQATIRRRLKLGWSIIDAIETPVRS